METGTIWMILGVLGSIGTIALFIMSGSGSIPAGSLSPSSGIEVATIVMVVIAIGIFIVAMYTIAAKNASGKVTLTELSFLSRSSGVLTSIFVAYLPLALIWLGPILFVLLLDISFMFPTILSIPTFFLVGTFEKLVFSGLESSATSNYSSVLNKITSP